MTQAVKRACDACHRRKVKCDGMNACRNCSSAQLSCTYNAIPQKKGPKGSRAKVISELRETQRQTSLSAKVQNRMNGIAGGPPSPSLSPTPGLLTNEMVKECVQFFFENMYPQMPILDRRQVEQQMLYMEQNRDAYCLLTALCAFVMLQPGMTMPRNDPFNLDMMPGANIVSSQLLVEEALRVRKGYEYLDSITLNGLATNIFLYGCAYGRQDHDRAWVYLREATTMVHLAGMNKEEHYLHLEPVESSRRRRLFWLLYTSERAYAIQRNRPLSLQATINLPTMNDDPTDPLAHLLHSFVLEVTLFKPFDDAFTGLWNKARGNFSSPYTTGLQKSLDDMVRTYRCQDPNLTDLHINQQWLKSTAWQFHNVMANGGGDDSMSFQLLVNMASNLVVQGTDVLNSGLIENLMDIVHSTIEFLSVQPASSNPLAPGPRDQMNQLLSIVAMSRNGEHRFLPLLLSKLTEIIPRLVNPMLQNAPENPNLANIDIFGGFGSAGMAQPPQMQMPLEQDYERKFPVEDYDQKYAMEMSGSSPDSATNSNAASSSQAVPQQATDMGSSYVSSPGLVSPVMEYPNMNGFACTPMSEMVMSPLGNAGQPSHMNTPTQHPYQQQQQQQQQQQHHQPAHQHMSQSPMGGMPPSNMHSQGMSNPITSHPMNGMVMRPPPQRQGSFHHQGPPQMRTVRDFQGLQRAGSDASGSMVNMNSMSQADMDFSAL
jgi:hypothetical protein